MGSRNGDFCGPDLCGLIGDEHEAPKGESCLRPVEIFDSTLRDGAQARKIAFTVVDKLNIMRALDRFGVRYIEAGNPTSNPKDMEFFERAKGLRLERAELVAFGSTHHRSHAPETDPLCQKLLEAGTDTVAIFGKASRFQAEVILGVTAEENLRMIRDTLRFFREKGRAVFFDAEHFFDGFAADEDYAFEVLRTAKEAGASRLVLCDTNGGTFPEEMAAAVRKAAERFGDIIGVHCHDDIGCAVAGSIAAVRAGAVQVQGTFLGFGERCGNANLSAIIPSLQLKLGLSCVPPESLPELTAVARYIGEVSNVVPAPGLPYVGRGAFAHKGGMHIAAVEKCPASFEHIDPAAVGNEREMLLSEMSGRASLLRKVHGIAPWLEKESPETAKLMDMLKRLEHEGYQFESATASFELCVLGALGLFRAPYSVELFKIIGERMDSGVSRLSSALVKVRVDERTEITAAEGEGPVNALDCALRKALEVFYPAVCGIHLIDYKVRVMEPGRATAAKVRVLIETTDGAQTWTTVGVSTDIINASFQALTDSVDYKLYLMSKTENLQLGG